MTIFQHTLGILVSPNREWQRIRNHPDTLHKVFFSHVPLLALIPTVSAYFGVTAQGWRIGTGGVVKLTPDSALILCVFAYFAAIASIYILGKYINWMSHSFGVVDDLSKRGYESMAMAVYSATPVMLAGIVLLWPVLWLVVTVHMAAVCYSIYLIFHGIPILMDIPRERGFIYGSSVITVALVLVILVMVTTVIIWSAGMGPVYTS